MTDAVVALRQVNVVLSTLSTQQPYLLDPMVATLAVRIVVMELEPELGAAAPVFADEGALVSIASARLIAAGMCRDRGVEPGSARVFLGDSVRA